MILTDLSCDVLCSDRYFGLDPIKWAMMYILNEDGFRDLASHKVRSFQFLHLSPAVPSASVRSAFGTPGAERQPASILPAHE